MQALQKFERKERQGFCAPGEDVVDNVVKLLLASLDEASSVAHGIVDDGRMLVRQLEVLGRKLMHHRVDLHNRGVDAVSHKRSGRGADAKTAMNNRRLV